MKSSSLNRRGFLGAIAGAIAARALPPLPFEPAPFPWQALDEFSERYIAPAMIKLANSIDAHVMRHGCLHPEPIPDFMRAA